MKSSFFIIFRISLPEKIFNQELNNIKNFRRQINWSINLKILEDLHQ